MSVYVEMRLEAAGVDWNVAIAGAKSEASPILFVHGFPLDWSMWKEATVAIAARDSPYRLILPDLPGFGKSQAWPKDVVTMADYADGLAALLDALHVVEPVTLVGLSMGGYIAFEFWKRHRERLRALALADTRAAPDTPAAAENRRATAAAVVTNGMRELADGMCDKLFATETKLRQAQSVDRLRGVMLRSNPRAVAATLLGMAERADASTWLQEIAVPTLVVCGAEDAITGPTEMEALARAIPDAEYATIMNAGHLAPTERPEAFVSVLRGFLERVRRTAR